MWKSWRPSWEGVTCARLTSVRPGWRYVATFNVRAVIKYTALRLHLSGVSYCPHAGKFFRLTHTPASSKRCAYSYGWPSYGAGDSWNIILFGWGAILFCYFHLPHPYKVIWFIIFLLRMIFLLTMLVRMIDIYSFNYLLFLLNIDNGTAFRFSSSLLLVLPSVVFVSFVFLCITNRVSLYKLIP